MIGEKPGQALGLVNIPKEPGNTLGKRQDSLLMKQKETDTIICILKGRMNPKSGILRDV